MRFNKGQAILNHNPLMGMLSLTSKGCFTCLPMFLHTPTLLHMFANCHKLYMSPRGNAGSPGSNATNKRVVDKEK